MYIIYTNSVVLLHKLLFDCHATFDSSIGSLVQGLPFYWSPSPSRRAEYLLIAGIICNNRNEQVNVMYVLFFASSFFLGNSIVLITPERSTKDQSIRRASPLPFVSLHEMREYTMQIMLHTEKTIVISES